MKKKFVCFSLMAIMMTAIVGTIVSCKDYDEDTYANLQGQLDENASVVEAMQSQLSVLTNVLSAVQTEQAAMEADLTTLGNNLSELNGNVSTLEANLTTLQTQLNKLAADEQSNAEAIEALQAQIESLESEIASATDQIIAVQGQLATIESAIAILEEAKDKTNEALDDINASLTNKSDSIASLFVQVTALSSEISGLLDSYESLAEYIPTIDQNSSAIKDLQDALADLKTNVSQCTCGETLTAYGDSLSNHYAMLMQLLADLTETNALANANQDRLVAVETAIADMATTADLQEVKERIEAVKDSLGNVIDGMSGILDEAKAYADELAAGLQGSIDGLQGSVSDLQGSIDGVSTTLTEFTTAVNGTLAENAADIEALKTRVTTLEGEVSDLTDTVNGLLKLQNVLNQLVTSILIQGTDNPVFGSISLPLNISSNVLAAYYGELTEETYFPTTNEAFYANTENVALTDEDLAMIGLSENAVTVSEDGILVSENGSNAGTLYLTVNPNTVDFTGLKFSLENSIGEESPVKLGEITPSDHKLTFGYTRSTDNGFYEAPAYINAEDVADASPRIDISELKEVISELKSYVTNGFSGLNVTSVLSTLYSQFTDVLDAEAVCAEWTDEYGDTHKTYSQYSLAATAIKPLSYAFLQDANYQNFPGIGRLENFINNIFNKISIPNFDLSDYNFSEIGNITLDENGRVKTTVTIHFDAGELIDQTIYVKDEDGNVIGSAEVKNGTIDQDVEVEIDITDLISDLEGDLNDIIDELNSYLSQINDLLAELEKVNNISSSLDDVQSKLISFLDKLNTKLCNIINSVNKTLQPIMLVETSDGFVKVSQIQSAPTVISSGDGVNIVPTSFTGEILAPAYQKMIAVTNVYSLDLSESAQTEETTSGPGGNMGGQGGPSFTSEGAPGDGNDMGGQGGPGQQQQQVGELTQALQTVNNSSAQLAAVVDGDVRSIEVSGLQAGYIYEFVFTAVDYSGKVAAEKFYIRVAE